MKMMLRKAITHRYGVDAKGLFTNQRHHHVMTASNINPNVLKAQYAVRGEIPLRAEEHAATLKKNPSSLPFSRITRCNIGNPQELGQLPITFFRQVLAICLYPALMTMPATAAAFPDDVIKRAKLILNNVPAPGAYTHSMGLTSVRNTVARYISERDGYPSDPENIFLSNGASSAISHVLMALVDAPNAGVLCPTPQYPVYSATLALNNGTVVPYYTNESNEWEIEMDAVAGSLMKARDNGINVKSMVVINPGNPTGTCLSEEGIREIIRFCKAERLVILADEVYQTNVYRPDTHPFRSFKKVLGDLGSEGDGIELFSFHSISKGMIGECGIRGGIMELTGIHPEVKSQLYKVASIGLCPNVPGQLLVDLMCNPPTDGDTSYTLYKEELNGIFESLRRRSNILVETLNTLEGVSCVDSVGAMYAFPNISLPKRAVAAALEIKKQPDTFYCLNLLDATGVCVVPGSGFGQVDGTWHFRCTFLPQEEHFHEFLSLIKDFHKSFMDKYRDED